jgi:hypothetical protein
VRKQSLSGMVDLTRASGVRLVGVEHVDPISQLIA